MKRILVVGAGGRVTDAVLPAVAAAAGSLELAGVFARRARPIEAGGKVYSVRTLDSLTEGDVSTADIVYVVVAKPAVGRVLRSLRRFDVGRLHLVLETPVVLFKHLHEVRQTQSFAQVSVAEDMAHLPWLPLVRRAVEPDGLIGSLRTVELDRSGYAYHGVALAKALAGDRLVRSGARHRDSSGEVRTLRLGNGVTVRWVNPRDYALGSIRLTGDRGTVTDRGEAGEGLLEPVVRSERCVGVKLGDHSIEFDDPEIALTHERGQHASLTARMQDMKRIGLLRLLREVAAGRVAYPAVEGLDDMTVDYHLERLGRYVPNPFTSARGRARPAVELVLRTLARLRR